MADEPTTTIRELSQRTKYPPEAFYFVEEGLQYTVNSIHGQLPPGDEREDSDEATGRHITGQQLCVGLREYAIRTYGLMARTVLKRWSIHRSDDFGQIVFAMVEGGLMKKTEEDHLDDFHDVFNFNDAFSPKLELSENN